MRYLLFPLFILMVFLVACNSVDRVPEVEDISNSTEVAPMISENEIEPTVEDVSESTEVTSMTTESEIEPTVEQSYPPPQSGVLLTDSYPSSQNINAYPVPRVVDESKRFTIQGPLHPGDTIVRGMGPPDVPIKIISISYVGEPLGFGSTNPDGTFNIEISPPLESNHVIAIQLSDESLKSDFLDGPGYTDIPMIGLVLTTSVVETE